MRNFKFSTLTAMALALVASSAASAGTIYLDDDLVALYSYSLGGARTFFSAQTPNSTDIGIAFNSSGTLYAATRDINAILEYTPSGVESTFVSVGSPYGIAVNAAGDVFTYSATIGDIMEYTPAGVGSVFATAPNTIYSLAFDSSGDLFAGDDGDVYKYAPNGTRTTLASGIGALVFGLAFDPAGNVYAADWNGQILKYAPNGTSTVFASFSTSVLPTGLVYDYSSGNLFMSEVANGTSQPGQQVIDEFSPTGVESTFASGLYDPFGIADLQTIPSSAPEPASYLLLGSGIAGIMLACRRFRA